MSSLKTTHRWAVAQQNPELEKELSAGLGIPGLVARIMVAHGIGSIKEGQLFLTPSLDRDWADPLIIPGMSVVADRVERAIRNHERIAVFGDFDVDGITSTCLLTEALRMFGADVTPFIPHRFDEGYGLSRAALDRVNELARPQLIVTVDNGIAAKEEVSYLESLGIDLVVTDHHEPSDQVPQGVPLTDPKLEDEGPSRELAGAGVALKLVQVLGERLGKPSYWRSLIEVAALGIAAGAHRHIAEHGLQPARQTTGAGLQAADRLAARCRHAAVGRVLDGGQVAVELIHLLEKIIKHDGLPALLQRLRQLNHRRVVVGDQLFRCLGDHGGLGRRSVIVAEQRFQRAGGAVALRLRFIRIFRRWRIA